MLNRYLGHMDPKECVVPPGARLVSLKYCEICAMLFARADGDKVCRRCHGSPRPLASCITVEILKELAEERPISLL